jgi:hypothetical protein
LFLLRVILPFAVLLLIGLAIAYVATKDRRFIRYLVLAVQVELLLVVAFGLIYVFERVFLL